MKIIFESAEEEVYFWIVMTGLKGMNTSPWNPGKEYAPYCPMDFSVKKDGADVTVIVKTAGEKQFKE